MTTATISNVTSLLEEFRAIADEREQIAARDTELSKRESEIKQALIEYHTSTGLESIKGGGMSITFDPAAVRIGYDPAKFNDIVKWAVETDNLHVLQRRFTESRIAKLIEESVPMPEGITFTPFVKLSARRT